MGIQIRNMCFEDLLMSALLGEKKKDKKEIDTKNLVQLEKSKSHFRISVK